MSQCVLKKVDPTDKTQYSKIVSANDQYQIPFFSTYRESNSYSGSEWMIVKSAEINGETVHYINQKTLPPKPNGDVTDRYNWIFAPHLWNFYDGTNTFVSKGVLDVFFLDKSNNQFKQVDVNTYNTDKSYSVHDNGNDDSHVISDSVEIPDAVKDLIAKKERLYVNFKWNDKPETFCGIYDFQNTIWNWVPVTDNDGNEDFDSSSYVFGTAVVPTTNDDEICKAMDDFVAYIHSGTQPSSASKPNPSTSVKNTYQNSSSNVGTNLNPTTVVAVTNPKTVVAVSNPDPSTVVAVSNPKTVVAVSNPKTVVAVTTPDPSKVVAVSNPDPTTTVAVSNPSTNFMMMPQFGTASEIYIKVIFEGIVPKTVDVVQESSVTSLEGDIDNYINGLLDGTKKSDENPVYFRLEKSYAENIVNMSSQ
jgi:hypothetical protein